MTCISKIRGLKGNFMNGADSTALFCIIDGVCLDWGRIICGAIGAVIGGIIVGLFNYFMGIKRKKAELVLENDNRDKQKRDDFFDKVRNLYYDFCSNARNAWFSANKSNAISEIEDYLKSFFDLKRMLEPCPRYINDDDSNELYKCVSLMDCYIVYLKYANVYRTNMDNYQQWCAAYPDLPYNSQAFISLARNNQYNIDHFDDMATKAENVKRALFYMKNRIDELGKI